MKFVKWFPLCVLSLLPISATCLAASYDEDNIRQLFGLPGWTVVTSKDLEKYDDIWFVSDIHGRLGKITNFLYQAGLTTQPPASKWIKSRQLFIAVGDYIDGGNSGAQVMDLLSRLTQEAAQSDSRIIALLGNHEAEFLADPRPSELTPETEESFATYLNQGKEDFKKGSAATILGTVPGQFASAASLGAVVGSWLFAHSGDLDTTEAGLPNFIRDLSKAWLDRAFSKLFSSTGKDLASLLSRHDWWDKHHDDLHKLIKSMGLTALIAGHERTLLDRPKEIAVSHGGWFMKIDAGMKVDFEGRMVHCSMKTIQPDAGKGILNLVGDNGKPTCLQLRSSGAQEEIPVN